TAISSSPPPNSATPVTGIAKAKGATRARTSLISPCSTAVTICSSTGTSVGSPGTSLPRSRRGWPSSPRPARTCGCTAPPGKHCGSNEREASGNRLGLADDHVVSRGDDGDGTRLMKESLLGPDRAAPQAPKARQNGCLIRGDDGVAELVFQCRDDVVPGQVRATDEERLRVGM